MSSILLTPQAIQDLEEIHDFIAADNPKTALEFIELLEEKMKSIADLPEMGRERKELAPKLRGFPTGHYVIFYRQTPGGIQVIRVLHGSRDIPPLFE